MEWRGPPLVLRGPVIESDLVEERLERRESPLVLRGPVIESDLVEDFERCANLRETIAA